MTSEFQDLLPTVSANVSDRAEDNDRLVLLASLIENLDEFRQFATLLGEHVDAFLPPEDEKTAQDYVGSVGSLLANPETFGAPALPPMRSDFARLAYAMFFAFCQS